MKLLKIAALVAAVAAKCPFGFDLEKDADGKVHEIKSQHRHLQASARYPSDILTCPSGAVNQTANMTVENYEDIVVDIIEQLN